MTSSGKFRWPLTIAIVLVAGGMLVSMLVWKRYQAFITEPLALGAEPVTVRVRQGDYVARVIQTLDSRGFTRFDWRWRLLLKLEPATMLAGEYSIPPGTTPVTLLERFASGKVIQHRFTIVEGWTYAQLTAALSERESLMVDPALLAADRIMALVADDASGPWAHPEGWFLPETYAYTSGDTALDVLRRAHQAMLSALEEAWVVRDPDLPLDAPYDLLKLASIVEKESSRTDEQPQVAGVFIRRLQQNWRLETDPTIIYGLGERFDGDIRRRDLKADNPYNTYIHHGLPPTPIAMPGKTSLFAVAKPADGKAMFFVADGKGGHVFSETLAQHNVAVRALIKRQKARSSTTNNDQGNE